MPPNKIIIFITGGNGQIIPEGILNALFKHEQYFRENEDQCRRCIKQGLMKTIENSEEDPTFDTLRKLDLKSIAEALQIFYELAFHIVCPYNWV